VKYRVRSADGEIAFDSIEALRIAASTGLVEESDDVLREDETTWRKASAMGLAGLQGAKKKRNPQTLWIALAVLLGIGAFVLLLKGGQDSQFYLYGGGLGFVVAGILFKVTRDAAKIRR
jgi:hypothetical protein